MNKKSSQRVVRRDTGICLIKTKMCIMMTMGMNMMMNMITSMMMSMIQRMSTRRIFLTSRMPLVCKFSRKKLLLSQDLEPPAYLHLEILNSKRSSKSSLKMVTFPKKMKVFPCSKWPSVVVNKAWLSSCWIMATITC